MPRGLGDIPDLRLEVLQKFVTSFTMPPELMLMNMFASSDSPSSTIKWESHRGSRGMTPFKPPGSPTPQTSPMGAAKHSAEAAFWGEKVFYDEEFLNNLRKEGTEMQYLDSRQRLARDMASIVNRANRRKEWMFAKMLFDGEFDYDVKEGYKATVDYDLPSDNVVSLGTDYKWSNGTSRDIISDIIDGKKQVADECGGTVDIAVCNSTVLKYLAQDSTIQTLLQKSAYGTGNLFSGNVNKLVGANAAVIGALLNIPNLVIYDEKYAVKAYLTAAVTGSSTVAVSVDSASDFEDGETVRFYDASDGSYEDETISSVDVEAGTVTVSTAPTKSFKAGEDYIVMTKDFVPDNKFCMFASKVENQPIAEYKRAPYGNNRTFGMKTDSNPVWDPEGIYIRVQDKGLPVLYQRDAVYILTVA